MKEQDREKINESSKDGGRNTREEGGERQIRKESKEAKEGEWE